MPFTINFPKYAPPARTQAQGIWEHVRIEEAEAPTGPWATVETITLDPPDLSPETPLERPHIVTEDATLENGWYRAVFVDAQGDEFAEPAIRSPYMAGESIAFFVRTLMPRTWEALRTESWYGDQALDLRIRSARYTELPLTLAEANESTYSFALKDFIAAVAALEIIPAGIEYWMRQKITKSATGTNENVTLIDPVASLKELEKRLMAKVERLRGNPNIIGNLALPGELPAISDDGDPLTLNPFDFPPAFGVSTGAAGTEV